MAKKNEDQGPVGPEGPIGPAGATQEAVEVAGERAAQDQQKVSEQGPQNAFTQEVEIARDPAVPEGRENAVEVRGFLRWRDEEGEHKELTEEGKKALANLDGQPASGGQEQQAAGEHPAEGSN